MFDTCSQRDEDALNRAMNGVESLDPLLQRIEALRENRRHQRLIIMCIQKSAE